MTGWSFSLIVIVGEGVIVSEKLAVNITTSELARRLLLSFSVINTEGAELSPTVNVILSVPE